MLGEAWGRSMTDEPRWPEWMDQKVLAAYIGKKPSAIRTLMKHGALPRPSRWGNIVLWNRRVVDRRLMMGGEDSLAEAAHGEAIRENVRRAREEARRPYRSIFDQADGTNVRIRRRRQRI
jgi:hypothetical protein